MVRHGAAFAVDRLVLRARAVEAEADDAEVDRSPRHARRPEPGASDVAPLAQRHLLELLEGDGGDGEIR